MKLNLQLNTDSDKLITLRRELNLITREYNLFNYLNEYSKKVIEKINIDEELTHSGMYATGYDEYN